jgi:hypothetical protein
VVIFFGGLGSLFLLKAMKIGKVGKRYIQYRNIIGSGQGANINNLAHIFFEKPELVETEIQELINDGYFPGVFINFGTKEIMYNTNQPFIQQVAVNNTVQGVMKVIQPKVNMIKCPNCGANNRVVDGKACECEYCSTPLS